MNHPRPSQKPKGKTIAILDIGSSKIACFIAHLDPHGAVQIAGIGHQLSKGVRSGGIVDVGEAETSIVAAVHAAEQMAGETVENVIVNLSGSHLLSRTVTVELDVAGEGVTEQDIADIIHEGQSSIRSADANVIHCFPVQYFLDQARAIKDPRGMIGNHLGCDLHMITAPVTHMRNIETCVARCHLNVEEYVASPHASALGVLEADEMDLGATVIDMGGGTTGIAVFTGGKNVFSEVIPIGGTHVTSDIAKGLSTSLAHAERLKTLHGSVLPSVQDEQVMIEAPQLGEDEGDEPNLMPRSMLVGVVRPRMEEIFEMIRSRLEAAGVDKVAGRRVVLTGGASQLMGVRDMASRILAKQVRLGKPQAMAGLADAVSGPAFAASLGMLKFATQKSQDDALFKPRRSKLGLAGSGERLMNWFKENF